MSQDIEKDKIESTQKSIKSRKNNNIDLEGDVLVRKTDLDILANAKYNKTITNKQISSKKSKMLIGIFSGIGAVALAAGIATLVVGINKANSSKSEETKQHDIVLPQSPIEGWTIKCSSPTAKKGDTVIFEVSSSSTNTVKYPASVIINSVKYPTVQKSETVYQSEVKIPFAEKMEVSVELVEYDPEIYKEHEIIVPQQPEEGYQLTCDKSSAKLGDTVIFTAKPSQTFNAKLPKQLDINGIKYDFVKSSESENIYTATIIVQFIRTMNAKIIFETEPYIKSIFITQLPNKLKYYVGDEFESTGLEVKSIDSIGETKVIDNTQLDITGFDSSSPVSSQTITITLINTQLTTTFSVEIIPIPESNEFNGVDWQTVISACDTYEAIETPTINNAITFCQTCGVPEPTYKNDDEPWEILSKNLVGLEGTITLNNQIHKIRCVDVEGAMIWDTQKMSALTFEFENTISDSNGQSIAVQWNDTNEISTSNNSYENSSIRYHLNGTGSYRPKSGTTAWFSAGQTVPQTDKKIDGKSVYDMLPQVIKSGIKKVTEPTYTYSDGQWVREWVVDDYLFLPTPLDLGFWGPNYTQYTELWAYEYYSNSGNQQKWSKRKKSQINTTLYASNVSGTNSITNYSQNINNFAGYCSSQNQCCPYWLMIQNMSSNQQVAQVSNSGYIGSSDVFNSAIPIAPIFSI